MGGLPLPVREQPTPRIETERLVLRPLTPADVGALHELYADPDAMRYVGPTATSVEESDAEVQRRIDHQDEHGFSLWAVVARESGNVIGEAGLLLGEGRGSDAELSFRLKVPAWGRGFATEAACAWVSHGFEELGLERIVALVHPDHAAALRVLEKVGMLLERETTHEGAPVQLHAIERGKARRRAVT